MVLNSSAVLVRILSCKQFIFIFNNILYLLVLAAVRLNEGQDRQENKQEQLKQAHAAQVRALQDEHRRQQEELLQVRQHDGLLVVLGIGYVETNLYILCAYLL